ncbi:hypothetical protein TGMAS_413090 [Toxoplasma gondii MAS]|uniref:Uncharacterized protein n=1 Tax=Toxoplasma gondii MAS TaxID=943118 RepID=A0A086QX24_TOXGO|nr:hypothetical protein TGMAS_413090 [Toxoplasma gondii MAS]
MCIYVYLYQSAHKCIRPCLPLGPILCCFFSGCVSVSCGCRLFWWFPRVCCSRLRSSCADGLSDSAFRASRRASTLMAVFSFSLLFCVLRFASLCPVTPVAVCVSLPLSSAPGAREASLLTPRSRRCPHPSFCLAEARPLGCTSTSSVCLRLDPRSAFCPVSLRLSADLALPSPGESLSPHLLGLSLAGSAGPLGGLPPFVYQPHYYCRLPSTQTRRSGNVFYPAPPAPTGQAELKRQALCHNTDVCDPIYRPAPELSASPQVNRGFNSVGPSGFLPGLAFSRETKQRRRELQGALLKRSAFPDEEPMSATQMNDMYIDMLLEEVDKRQ